MSDTAPVAARNRFVEFCDEWGRLLDSTAAADRTKAVTAAAAFRIGYCRFGEAIESDDRTTPEEKQHRRQLFDSLHVHATRRLMREAERVGLNPAPLSEERRVCQELFRHVRAEQSKRPRAKAAPPPHGIVWFHHPHRTYDSWPEALGPWRYALPAGMQEAIRQGEEVFTRLLVKLDLQETEAEAAVGRAVSELAPRTMPGADRATHDLVQVGSAAGFLGKVLEWSETLTGTKSRKAFAALHAGRGRVKLTKLALAADWSSPEDGFKSFRETVGERLAKELGLELAWDGGHVELIQLTPETKNKLLGPKSRAERRP